MLTYAKLREANNLRIVFDLNGDVETISAVSFTNLDKRIRIIFAKIQIISSERYKLSSQQVTTKVSHVRHLTVMKH